MKTNKDNYKLKVNVKFQLFDENGNLKTTRRLHNAKTNNALYGLLDQLLDTPTLAKVGYMELGTDTPTATLLGAYIPGSRTAITKTRILNVVTITCTFAPGVGTGNITEAALFDVVTENTVNMWASGTDFTMIPKTATDALIATWTLTLN
jgi:hypothetical protein